MRPAGKRLAAVPKRVEARREDRAAQRRQSSGAGTDPAARQGGVGWLSLAGGRGRIVCTRCIAAMQTKVLACEGQTFAHRKRHGHFRRSRPPEWAGPGLAVRAAQ